MGRRSINSLIKCLKRRRDHIATLLNQGVKNPYYNEEWEALEMAIPLMEAHKETKHKLQCEQKEGTNEEKL